MANLELAHLHVFNRAPCTTDSMFADHTHKSEHQNQSSLSTHIVQKAQHYVA